MALQKVNYRKLKQAESYHETAIKLCNEGKWTKALEYYEKSLEIYQELGDKQGILISYFDLGSLYQDKGEWDKALEFYEKSLEIYQELGDKQGTSACYNNLGLLYQDKGEWDKALEFYEKSLEIYQELGDKQGISTCYNNRGVLYQDKGEWDKALEFYEKSLEIYQEAGSKKGISTCYNNLGLLYKNKGEWDKALEFYEKSLEIDQELGYKQGISTCYNNLGLLHQDKGEWDKALEFYEKSLEIDQELGNKQGISITFSNLGELNIKSGNWESSKKYLEDSLKIAEKLAPISTVSVLKNLGELSILEDKYDEAMSKLDESMNIVKSIGAKPWEIGIYEKYGDVYLSKYIAEDKVGINNLELVEENYQKAFELAKSLEIPLKEATAIRGLGIVASKKGNMKESERYFRKSLEILGKLGALFEFQKTTFEYAKEFYENENLFEAEIRAKSVAFDAQRSKNYELLRKVYLLLGDIAVKQDEKYEYYLISLETAKFNPKIYVRNCYHLIFRMRKMDQKELAKFISLLKGQNDEKYFDLFLEALNNKIEGKEYKISELPSNLAQELEKFDTIPASVL